METQSSMRKDNNNIVSQQNVSSNNVRSSVGIVETRSSLSNAATKPKTALKQVKISSTNGADLVNNSNTNMQVNLSNMSDEQDIFKVV